MVREGGAAPGAAAPAGKRPGLDAVGPGGPGREQQSVNGARPERRSGTGGEKFSAEVFPDIEHPGYSSVLCRLCVRVGGRAPRVEMWWLLGSVCTDAHLTVLPFYFPLSSWSLKILF